MHNKFFLREKQIIFTIEKNFLLLFFIFEGLTIKKYILNALLIFYYRNWYFFVKPENSNPLQKYNLNNELILLKYVQKLNIMFETCPNFIFLEFLCKAFLDYY